MCNVKSQVIQQDVPAVSIELAADQFKAVLQAYDVFSRIDVSDTVVLDATSFDNDEIDGLETYIGREAAEEAAGQFVFFYVGA